jgi:hypothetical protein
MSEAAANVLSFAVKNRWTVVVESERLFVRVRHRRTWYTVARRVGHEDRRYRCASRADAMWIAEQLRIGFEHLAAVGE